MDKSASIKELATALNKAQAEMPMVKFNSKNPFLNNKYADLGAVIETAKPILSRNGLSISQMPWSENGYVGLTTVLMHSSGEWIESTVSILAGDEKGKSLAQVAGSIITYLRRYAYAAALGMYADEDSDGNNNGHKPERQEENRQIFGQPEAPKYTPPATPPERPYPPEYLRDRVAKNAKAKGNVTPTDKQKGLLASMLEQCFAGDPDSDKMRRSVQKYLTGCDSVKDMPGAMIVVLLDWLAPKDAGGGAWQPAALAVKEAQLVVRQSAIDAGQLSLLETGANLGATVSNF